MLDVPGDILHFNIELFEKIEPVSDRPKDLFTYRVNFRNGATTPELEGWRFNDSQNKYDKQDVNKVKTSDPHATRGDKGIALKAGQQYIFTFDTKPSLPSTRQLDLRILPLPISSYPLSLYVITRGMLASEAVEIASITRAFRSDDGLYTVVGKLSVGMEMMKVDVTFTPPTGAETHSLCAGNLSSKELGETKESDLLVWCFEVKPENRDVFILRVTRIDLSDDKGYPVATKVDVATKAFNETGSEYNGDEIEIRLGSSQFVGEVIELFVSFDGVKGW